MKNILRGRFNIGFDRFKNVVENNQVTGRVWKYFAIKISRIRRDAYDSEIFNSCILLKNLSLVHRESPISTDSILEELIKSSTLLKEVYAEILFRWRNGMGTDSFRVLEDRVGTVESCHFAHILSQLDTINPVELISSMESFSESFSGDRMTRAMRKNYIKSVVTTVSAMVSFFAVLMNFVVVVILLNMFDMLSGFSVM